MGPRHGHHEGVSDTEVIRVLVVDDHRVVRQGLASYLALVDDLQMVGDAPDGRAALDSLARAKAEGALPDVVLMDLLMGRWTASPRPPPSRSAIRTSRSSP